MKNKDRFRNVEIGDVIKMNDGTWCPVTDIYQEWFYVEHPDCKGIPLRYDGSNNGPHGYYGHLHAYMKDDIYRVNEWYRSRDNRYFMYLGEKYAPGTSGTDDISGGTYHVWREAGATKEILSADESPFHVRMLLIPASLSPDFENMQPGDMAWSFQDGDIIIETVKCVSAGDIFPIAFTNNNTCTRDGKASHGHRHPTYFTDIFQAKAYAEEYMFKGKMG